MNREDIQKLLGGYATGTLTPEEQQMLFEAALGDQELFDALAREQSLRDLLADPTAKAHLLAALDERPARWWQSLGWWRPAAAAIAMAGLAAVGVIAWRQNSKPQTVLVAEVKPAEIKQAPAPMAAPVIEPPQAPKPVVERPKPLVAADIKQLPAPPPPPAPIADPQPAAPALRDAAPAVQTTDAEKAKKEVREEKAAGVAGFVAPPPENARALFYGATPLRQNFAAQNTPPVMPGTAQQTGGAPAPQQQAQQGQQSQLGQNQLITAGRIAAMAKAQMAAAPAADPGVKYRLLRRSPANELVEASVDKLTPSDIVTVEFTANQDGQLTVTSPTRTLFAGTVEKLKAYAAGPLSADEKLLTVLFTRTAGITLTRAVDGGTRKDLDTRNLEQREGDVNYVVAQPTSDQVRFTIRLDK